MRRSLAPLALALLLATMAVPALAAEQTHVFALATQNQSGELGTVTLIPVSDKATRVEVALAGSPAGIIQPAHIHDGPCAKLNPKPKIPLTPVVDGYSVTTVSMPISALIGSSFAVNVHESATKISTYVACGDLTAK